MTRYEDGVPLVVSVGLVLRVPHRDVSSVLYVFCEAMIVRRFRSEFIVDGEPWGVVFAGKFTWLRLSAVVFLHFFVYRVVPSNEVVVFSGI